MNDKSRIDAACRVISTGRRLASELSTALRPQRVSEPEFRLLRLLENAASDGELDQTALRRQLGVSAAQVSTMVERLRKCGLIRPNFATNDRRRQLWRLTPAGRQEFANAAVAVDARLADGPPIGWDQSRQFEAREDAA